MDLLGLEETWDRPAKVNGVRLHGHVLRKDNDDELRTLDFGSGWKKRKWTIECDLQKAGS